MTGTERIYYAAEKDVKLAAFLYSSAISNKKHAEAKRLADILTQAEPDNYDMYHAAFLPRFEEEDIVSAFDYLDRVKDKFAENPAFVEDYLCAMVKAEKYDEAADYISDKELSEVPSLIYLKSAENVYMKKNNSKMLRACLEKEYALYNTTAAGLGLALLHIESAEFNEAFEYLSQIKRASSISRPLFISLYLHSICMMKMEIAGWEDNMRENANILAEAAASNNSYFWTKELESDLRRLLGEEEASISCKHEAEELEAAMRLEFSSKVLNMNRNI